MTEPYPLALKYFTDPPPAMMARDLSALQARAYAAIGLRGWSASEIIETMESPAGRLLIACRGDGAVCGFVLASVFDGDGEVLILAVDPACRRLNIATRLIQKLMSDKNSTKIERLVLEVATTNFTAIAFYQILNFSEIGIRRNYYLIDGQKIDAQLMEKRIVQI